MLQTSSLWKSYGNLWQAMEIEEKERNLMEINGNKWNLMEINGI